MLLTKEYLTNIKDSCEYAKNKKQRKNEKKKATIVILIMQLTQNNHCVGVIHTAQIHFSNSP